ncbi:MAG: aminotransferase class V-fold PLP-dependent enzyme, partial [Myxococcales bacterium]|nr:aminotransferase class V-fold PLP-dependent enzyme [Myxococcales bacterium]
QRLAAMDRIRALRDRLRAGLRDRLGRAYVEHGDPDGGLPNTLAFRIAGVPGDVLLAALDLEGVALSSGSACASGAVEPSPVLRAMGLDDETARQGLRASLGPETRAEDIERVLTALPALVQRAQAA